MRGNRIAQRRSWSVSGRKKESCSKLTGEGLSADFSRIDTVHGAFYQERELPGGYYVSVCTQQRMESASWVMVEL